MIFPIGCYSFVMTQWHRDNPNDWVALSGGTYTNDLRKKDHHILYGRGEDLSELVARMKAKGIDATYGKAWGLGIDKDYPITEKYER